MNDAFYVEVAGLAELEVALRELPDATSRNVLRRVAKKVLAPIADRARVLAPYKTGRLIHSIIVGNKLTRHQKSQAERGDPDDVIMYVGAGALPQAHMMEYGTVHLAPQPFMRPAWDGGKEQVLADIKGELWTEIDKAAKRLARKAAKAAGG